MDWVRMLAYVTGTVDQELLARNEYLAAENRILKAQLRGRLSLSNGERGALGEIGHRLGRKVLANVATIARPDTILGWYRKLVARKFDGSKARRSPGRPRTNTWHAITSNAYTLSFLCVRSATVFELPIPHVFVCGNSLMLRNRRLLWSVRIRQRSSL